MTHALLIKWMSGMKVLGKQSDRFYYLKDGVIKAYAQGRIGLMNVLQNKVNLDHKKLFCLAQGKWHVAF